MRAQHARYALELRHSTFGVDHPEVAADRGNFAAILDALGRLDEAEQLPREAIATFEAHYGAGNFEVGVARTNLAATLHRQGRLSEAETEYRHGLVIRERERGPDHAELVDASGSSDR